MYGCAIGAQNQHTLFFYCFISLFLRISVTPFLFEATKLQIKIDFPIFCKNIFKKKRKNRTGIAFLLFLLFRNLGFYAYVQLFRGVFLTLRSIFSHYPEYFLTLYNIGILCGIKKSMKTDGCLLPLSSGRFSTVSCPLL